MSVESVDRRVALIISHVVIAKVIRTQLQQWRCVVQPATSQAPDTFIDASVILVDADPVDNVVALRAHAPLTPIVAVARRDGLQSVLRAVRQGAFDYIVVDEVHIVRQLVYGETFGADIPDPLRIVVDRAIDHRAMVRRNEELVAEVTAQNRDLSVHHDRLTATLANLRATKEKLVQAEKAAALGVLVAGVGNQINNPLTALNSVIATLGEWANAARDIDAVRELPLTNEVPTLLDDCRSLVDRIAAVARALREFAAPGPKENAAIDLDLLFAELEAEGPDGIEIVGPTRAQVRGDRQKLRQALGRLVDNAAEAYEADEEVRIRIEARSEAGWVDIAIRDWGAGITADDLPRVFDPFFTTKKSRKAMGLGLSMAGDALRKMGGELTLDSVEGEGTTAKVRLPRWAESKDRDASAESAESSATADTA